VLCSFYIITCSVALAKAKAFTYFSKPEFPQVRETVNTLLLSKANSVTKVPDPTTGPTTEESNNIHNWCNKPLGIIAIGVINHYLDLEI
jgi:hypothetical protein